MEPLAHTPFVPLLSRRSLLGAAAALALAGCASVGTGTDALPAWNDGANKQAILKFVADVTRDGAPTFVPPAERIAVFDNDGTLWVEQPMYTQMVFVLDWVKANAAQHPEWRDNAAFKALASGDREAIGALSERELAGFIYTAQGGLSDEAYDAAARDWLARARHPKFNRPYTELVYQPQLELLAYLRSKGFKTFIVSGGSVEFMRPWSERVYGIPPEQVIGTQNAMRFEMQGGKPALLREPKIDFVDDGPGKPVGIYKHIGRRPVLAFGNSDGDWQMLQYTMGGSGSRMALLVLHDDGEREVAYDRRSKIGRLDKAWNDALAKGWNVVSMRRDWRQVFPPPKN
ncbi:MAG TPA: HAD family hydrolase [Burkholderiaceae bacterium]|nr:HAD family hydrolase [Burkholderiaceae bacterium]